MSCDLAYRDGAYVLGALSPSERLAFEQHLPGCETCARSVRELAGLPGLLSRVDASVLEEPLADHPVPETLLPALLGSVRQTRRRRWLVSVGAAAATAAVVSSGFVLTRSGQTEPPVAGGQPTSSVAPSAAPALTMAPVGEAPVRASIRLASAAWGTRLDLTCTYLPTPPRYHLPKTALYALFVRTRQGHIEQVGTWQSDVGQTMRLMAATSVPRRDIASVEVRTADGRAVLELTA
jgi:hypothetical protein